MKKIIQLIESYRLKGLVDVAIFMGILLFFHFLYKNTTDIFSKWEFYRNSSEFLSVAVYHWVEALVKITGIPFEAFDFLTKDSHLYKRAFLHYGNLDYNVIYVSWGCSGFKQFYQWIFLMILFPGPWKHKLWYIPAGLAVIYGVNVLRIYSLLITTMYSPDNVHFVHDDIVRPFFYVVMFALWVFWNDKIRFARKKID